MTSNIGVVYLSEYRVALSSLAFHLLYKLVERRGYGAHRITVEKEEIKDWDSKAFNPKGFDLLLISIPYELLYKDLASFLDRMNLKMISEGRNENDPLIIVGGPAVTANPLPIAPLADGVLIGEAEEIMDKILEISTSDYTRIEKKKKLAEIDGLLVWKDRETIPTKRLFVTNIDSAFFPTEQIIEKNVSPIWGRSFMVEVSRGCGRGCLFCMEGRIFLPMRHRSMGVIRRIIKEGLDYPSLHRDSYEKITFYSLSFFDHPESESIIKEALKTGLVISVPSIRVDTLTEKKISLILEGGQKTLTLAPETGSCRLAESINKKICPETVLDVISTSISLGFKQFKLYFLTGIYGETKRDLYSTVELVNKVGDQVRRVGGRLKLSINPLIPKPNTPFQWHGFVGLKEARYKLNVIRQGVSRNVHDFSALDPRYARLQTILSRGGPELARPIALWGQMQGLLSSWRTVVKRFDLKESYYLSFWDPEYEPVWHQYIIDPFNKIDVLREMYKLFLDAQNKFLYDS